MVDWSTTTRKHGTLSGYQFHKELGEEACPKCLKANRTYSNSYYNKTKNPVMKVVSKVDWSNTKRKHGTLSGYQFHKQLKEEACPRCLKAYRTYYVAYRAKNGNKPKTITVDWSTTTRKHGTRSGYQFHKMLKEPACAKCIKANRNSNRPYVTNVRAQSMARTALIKNHKDEYDVLYRKFLKKLSKEETS